MRKMKTTRKFINESYCNKMAIGYCEAQTILKFYDCIAYTCGVYGWNCDVYFIPSKNVCITTGYRGLIHDLDYNYNELRDLENKARELSYNSTMKYEEYKKVITTDFEKWLDKVLEENNRK